MSDDIPGLIGTAIPPAVLLLGVVWAAISTWRQRGVARQAQAGER